MRKILHIDMDAFYASVEQRADPALRGRPLVVAWLGARSVVCAASYEARAFGIHSAMPAMRAERLCPDAIFVAPDFSRYREASRQVREIFLRYTDLVEPLSLDEAYLDVTSSKSGLPSATAIAEHIRAAIRNETGLTASAGVACNKFLAKIASDWRKPDGLFVIRPDEVADFLRPLPVGKIPGVGAVMQRKLAQLGVQYVGDLETLAQAELEARFGRYGVRLHELARGIDQRAVQPDRPTLSISTEDTLEHDAPVTQLEPHIRRLAEKTWEAIAKQGRGGRTVVLKLKTAEFRILTRSVTLSAPVQSLDELATTAVSLCNRVRLPSSARFRLVGVGVANFDSVDASIQPELFASADT